MSVFAGSGYSPTALPGIDDVVQDASGIGLLRLEQLLDSASGGLCFIDCEDGYRIVYANRAARGWAPLDRLGPVTSGGLLEVVARAWVSGEPAQLRSIPLGRGDSDRGRLWDVEVQPLCDSGGPRRYVLVSTREAARRTDDMSPAREREQSALRVVGEPSTASSRVKKGISERERQVAELVALGLTNSDIAARLYLSRATVASHVAGILTKLRFRSRAQVAVWVVEQRQRLVAG